MRAVSLLLLLGLALLQPAWAADDVKAQLARADKLYIAKDFVAARAIYKSIAEAGNAEAEFKYGNMLWDGSGGPQDRVEADRWNQKASDGGYGPATFNVGNPLTTSKRTPEEKARGLALLKTSFEQGYRDAAARIGMIYEEGIGVLVSYKEAARWYRLGAEYGNYRSQALYARMLANGNLPQDLALARKYAELGAPGGEFERKVLEMVTRAQADAAGVAKAPEADAGKAEYDEGSKYFFKDKAKAFEWFSKAAALGHLQSRINVAAAYAEGAGVARDDRRARALFLAVAEEGNKYAQRTVANFMMNGTGGPQDYAGARYWLERAANQNDTEAMTLLGMMYDPAENRAPDMALATFWYQAAHARGNVIAENWLKAKGLLQPPPAQQAFINRIDTTGPDRSSSAAFHYDVGVYCQYGGKACNALRGQAYRFEQANNRAAEAANQQRLWSVYRREAADPGVRSECLRKKADSIWRSNSGQQDWYYAGEC